MIDAVAGLAILALRKLMAEEKKATTITIIIKVIDSGK